MMIKCYAAGFFRIAPPVVNEPSRWYPDAYGATFARKLVTPSSSFALPTTRRTNTARTQGPPSNAQRSSTTPSIDVHRSQRLPDAAAGPLAQR